MGNTCPGRGDKGTQQKPKDFWLWHIYNHTGKGSLFHIETQDSGTLEREQKSERHLWAAESVCPDFTGRHQPKVLAATVVVSGAMAGMLSYDFSFQRLCHLSEVREASSSERNQWVVFGRDRESNSPKVTQSQSRWNGQPWTRHYFRASYPASLFPLMVCLKMGMLQFQMIFCGNEMLDALKMKTILREIGHGALWGWWDGWWVLLKHKEINKLASRYNFKRTAVLISGLASPSPFQQKVKFQAGTSLSSTRSTPVTSPWAGLWKAI